MFVYNWNSTSGKLCIFFSSVIAFMSFADLEMNGEVNTSWLLHHLLDFRLWESLL